MPWKLELERAGVLALGGIEIEEAAAGEAAAIDAQADAVGRLEAGIDVERPEIAALVREAALSSTPMRSTLTPSGPSSPPIAAESSTGILPPGAMPART